jgi:hypothetical protein
MACGWRNNNSPPTRSRRRYTDGVHLSHQLPGVLCREIGESILLLSSFFFTSLVCGGSLGLKPLAPVRKLGGSSMPFFLMVTIIASSTSKLLHFLLQSVRLSVLLVFCWRLIMLLLGLFQQKTGNNILEFSIGLSGSIFFNHID